MAKRRLKLWGEALRFVKIEEDATEGGTIGRDIYNADGTLFDPETVITEVIEAVDNGDSNSGFTAIWKFILEIPQNVLNVVQGFPMVKKILPSAETLTVAVNYQLIVYGSFTNDGDIIIDGDLVIL